MKRLYFVRHGESELNVRQIYAGHIDTPLTVRGREQARLAGAGAKDLPINLIVSSPLSRAFETERIIATTINYPLDRIVVNDLFIEQSYGSLAGQPWTVPPDPQVYPDIETTEALTARAHSALEYLQGLDADNILVASHGSFANALCSNLQFNTGVPELPNAEIVQLI